MRFFQKNNIIAFMSDKAMDFKPTDFDAPLTEEQRIYLKQECQTDIPHVFWRKQVHGDVVLVAKGSTHSSIDCPDADAYITCQKNLPIAIRTADCVPVFLYDPMKKTIGLAHAGWKGTVARIAYKTVLKMQESFGSDPKDILAVLGPSIQPCCYEVGQEFRGHFPEDIIERKGKLYADVTKNNLNQLIEAGLSIQNINNTGICTCCHSNYFSYRRDGAKAGRMISLMQIL